MKKPIWSYRLEKGGQRIKPIFPGLLVVIMFFVGSAFSQKEPSISANGAPLTFQVVSASATQEAQSSEQMDFSLPPAGLTQAVITGTYNGPLRQNIRYQPLLRTSSESFVTVEFSVSNVKRKLGLSKKDVQVMDSKGSVYQTLGSPGHKKNSWFPFDTAELDPKKENTSTWIFKLPTDVLSGAVIQFQNTTYALPAVLVLPAPDNGSGTLAALEIHEAAQKGDLAKVRESVKNNPNLVLSKDIDGITPLHAALAVTPGNKEVVEFLLANGADVNAKDADGRTPLRYAALNGDKDMVELLVANHADLNLRDNTFDTPLHLAVKNNRNDVAKLLIVNHADANAGDRAGFTPLHSAIIRRQKDVVELLLANHADANAKERRNQTPLHFAASRSDKDVVELLLANNSDVNAKDINGDTPLHLAVKHSEEDVAELLLANHGDVNAQNKGGWTPLHMAVSQHDKDLVKLLLANHADVNAKDNDGRTPLHASLFLANLDIVKLLLENHADVNAKDNQGLTPLRFAKSHHRKNLVELLRQYSSQK